VLFAVAYLLVRLLHIVLYTIVGRDDHDLVGAVLRFAPTALLGASLLVVAGFLGRDARVAVWVTALAIDYIGPALIGRGRGWRIAPEHFAERHGLIVLIALGESIVAIGVGAGFDLGAGAIVAATLGIVVVSALWWLYFDVAAILARGRLVQARGVEQARLARDAYSYLHLPMVAGIVLFALGLKTTLGDVGEHLATVPAVGLCGGAALYLVAHRLHVPDDAQNLPAADDRRRRALCAHSRCGRDPGDCGARPGQRGLLTRGRVRGGHPPRAQGPGPAPRPRCLTRYRSIVIGVSCAAVARTSTRPFFGSTRRRRLNRA
jgi:low temperature requirement protein LtrA